MSTPDPSADCHASEAQPASSGLFTVGELAHFGILPEYLGGSLRKKSPKFFGSGAVNLEMFAKKRSELWMLLKDEINTFRASRNGRS